MPELPDIEIFKKNLKGKILNKTIKETGCNLTKSLINTTQDELKRISRGQKIIKIERRGKHLILGLSNNYNIVIHLMLSGKLDFQEAKKEHPFTDCIWFLLEDGNELTISDKARWVKVEVFEKSQKSKLLSKLGVEANKLSLGELTDILKSSRLGRIKPLLTDQKKIAGIGNAYVDEILWASKIHPNKTASLLTDSQIKILHNNIARILKWGIKNIEKEVDSSLQESSKKWMNVYRKKTCPRCHSPIKFIRVNQRDTFFCPKCQR